ncbi:MAG: superoxide dismutase family protein [Actinomycetota bacterium]|nr:superoxide dismutase family protein [Actinomycetota bacterium]
MKLKTRITVVFSTFFMGVSGIVATGSAAGSVEVVKGRFSEFSTGVSRGYDISGPVRLTVGEDWTRVRANVRGLAPNTTYASHLHESACSVADGGGHYKNDPAGPATPPNELWLTYETNRAGTAHDASSAPWAVREGARSVVIHDQDGARIACADLVVD